MPEAADLATGPRFPATARAAERYGRVKKPARPLADTLSVHLAETVEAVAQLHADHRQSRTRVEATIDAWTRRLARPPFLAAILSIVLGWIGLNIALRAAGHGTIDPPPFPWLFDMLTLVGVLMGILILSTQQRADRLAAMREQMTLELASVTERKVAKVIELIEELRRDMPAVRDRVDAEAKQMSVQTDPAHVLTALKESHDERKDDAPARERSPKK
jgi:uncharacterized membrane protein